MNKRDNIEQVLKDAFSPENLEVIDESHKHEGHEGMDGKQGTGTHFKVIISSKRLDGQTTLQKHRSVMNALNEIMLDTHSISVSFK